MGDEILDKLRAALALVETLKAENDLYKDNFEKLKSSHETLMMKHEDAIRENDVALKEKDLANQESQQTLMFWKAQLEEREQELDAIKAKASSFAYIRDELEQSQRGKWQLMIKECDKYREMYYKSKREVESLRLDNDQRAAAFDRSTKDLKREQAEQIKQWEARLVILQQSMDAESDTERLRVCQREKKELELRVSSLLSELDELRAVKEQLKVDYEQMERVHKRQLAEHLSEAKNLASERDSLVCRLSSLETELKATLNRQDDLLTENKAITKELDKTKSRLEESAHEFNVAVSDMKVAALKERNDSQNQINVLQERISELKAASKTLNMTIQDLRNKLSNSEKEYLERIRLVREEEWSKISSIECEKSEEQDRLKREIQDLIAQNDTVNSSNRTLIAEKEHMSSELSHSQAKCHDLDVQLSTASNSLDMYKRESQVLSEKVTALEALVKTQSVDLDTLQDQFDKERQAFLHNLERQKNAIVQERFQLGQRIEALTKENIQALEKIHELDGIIVQQRKIFETKLLSLRDKAKSYKAESLDLRKSLEEEHKQSRQQLDEMRRKQAGFMNFLKAEGLAT
eukprot:jgi/Hompol1/766/HPOL_001366-RA